MKLQIVIVSVLGQVAACKKPRLGADNFESARIPAKKTGLHLTITPFMMTNTPEKIQCIKNPYETLCAEVWALGATDCQFDLLRIAALDNVLLEPGQNGQGYTYWYTNLNNTHKLISTHNSSLGWYKASFAGFVAFVYCCMKNVQKTPLTMKITKHDQLTKSDVELQNRTVTKWQLFHEEEEKLNFNSCTS